MPKCMFCEENRIDRLKDSNSAGYYKCGNCGDKLYWCSSDVNCNSRGGATTRNSFTLKIGPGL